MNRGSVRTMDLALVVRAIRAQIHYEHVHVGSQDPFGDETSLIFEFGDCQALEAYKDHIHESIIVSKKKAIVTMLAPKDLIEPILTLQMKEAPLEGVSCIRFRKALNLPNNIWLKPVMTDLQVDRARQQASVAKKLLKDQVAASLLTRLRVEGLPQVEHIAICWELMQKVCEAAVLPLTPSSGGTLGLNEWAIDYRADGTFAQQVSVQLASEAALKALIMNVHGCGVRVAGRNLAVEVRAIHVKAEYAGMSACSIVSSVRPPGGGPFL
jgi:hypothetical protein